MTSRRPWFAVSGRRRKRSGCSGIADMHRIVTMASIVEKETAVPEERPLVASVYYNRLAKNMALAADPTVIYAALLAGRYRGTIYAVRFAIRLALQHLQVSGTAPGPIANPGVASLEAAHASSADAIFLYFVSDNNGHHRFARELGGARPQCGRVSQGAHVIAHVEQPTRFGAPPAAWASPQTFRCNTGYTGAFGPSIS